jgi:hypothetical protein
LLLDDVAPRAGERERSTRSLAEPRADLGPRRLGRLSAAKKKWQTPKMDEATRTELEAAAFRRLVQHLRERNDVQNIDLMNLAGFCRNCLSKWYRAAAEERGLGLSDPEAREIVYGMPYEEWKAKYQK